MGDLMLQLTIDDAIAARDKAMTRVAANNEALNAGWQELAFSFLKQYASRNAKFFPWDVLTEFEKGGFIGAADDRAWGQVYRRAIKEGIIARGTEIGKHPRRHATAVIVWRSLTCKAQ